MWRGVGTFLSGAVLVGVAVFAARPDEPPSPAPARPEPLVRAGEHDATTVAPAHSATAAAVPLETFALPPGVVFHRVEISADGAPVTAGEEKLIYSNTLGNIAVNIATSLVSDDIATVSGGGCRLTRIEFPVVGKVNATGIGGPYSVTFGMYSTCPGSVPFNPPGANVLIPGTSGQVSFPDDGPRMVSFSLPGAGVVLPSQNVWFGVKFSRTNAGVLMGAPADIGFSNDQFDFPGFPCSGWLGYFPEHPHASFNLRLFGDPMCGDAFAGYKNSRPSAPSYSPGQGFTLVDDVRPGVPSCLMTGYEVAVRGVGFFEFDMRRECEGDVIAGTEMVYASSSNAVQIARFPLPSPVPLPEDVFFATKVNNGTAGIVFTGVQSGIGSTQDLHFVAQEECVTDYHLDPAVHDAVNLTITCAGQPPMGACCDMAFARCVGGPDDGRPCCPASRELGPFCDEDPLGRDYYPSCAAPGNCELGCREVPQMNCPWPWPQWTSTAEPGWVEGAACDPDPFPFACGSAACCRPDDVCQNMDLDACYAVEPTESPRAWQRGRYCGQPAQTCPIIACLSREGDCMFAHQEAGCSHAGCCDAVCREDSYCCLVEWDRSCVEVASAVCDTAEHYECAGRFLGEEALAVAADSVTVFSNAFAPESTANPVFCCSGDEPGSTGFGTTWFKFVATDASALVSTCGSDPAGDSLINVFAVADPTDNTTACASLIPIACSDDAEDCGSSRHGRICVHDLVPSQPYYVMVASKTPEDRGVHQLQIRSPCFTEPIWIPADCNENGLADGCEVGRGTAADCNLNHLLDECDISSGAGFDCDGNHFLDECAGVVEVLEPFPGVEGGTFGSSVAMQDPWLVVGAGFGEESVPAVPLNLLRIYERLAEGWRPAAKFELPSYPSYVALDGDWIVATSMLDASAHLFHLEGSTWTAFGVLQGPDVDPCLRFGVPVAIHGDRIALSKGFCQEGPGPAPEVVSLFRFDGAQWLPEAQISMPKGNNTPTFGSAVALYGERLMVGAFSGDDISPEAAFVFRLVGKTWGHEATLQRPDGSDPAAFGRSVALTDEYAFVGATIADAPNGQMETGAVYVFRRVGSTWSYHQKLTAADANFADRFGWWIDISDSLLAIGARFDSGIGSVYAFQRRGFRWFQRAKLVAPVRNLQDNFGLGVAADTSLVAVGSPQEEAHDLSDVGRAYVFQLPQLDCNENGVGDDCDVRDGASLDCNTDDVPDECSLADGTTPDCNHNGVPDDCDIASGLLPDCDFDGVPDPCEIKEGNPDCNCDGIDNAEETDCDFNGWPDLCDIVMGAADCDGDGLLDGCEISYELAQDCNANQIPDDCELAQGAYPDCNLDGEIDACDIADGSSADCNANGIPDECDLAGGTLADDDGDGIPTQCEPDCQPNGVIDDLDIESGTSADCNADGRPDECGAVDHCDLVRLVPWSPYAYAGFGAALAADREHVLVGAPNANGGIGKALLYRRTTHGWARVTKFPPEVGGGAEFGTSVALAGDIAVVGAPGALCEGDGGCGAAFVYGYNGFRWLFQQQLVPSEPAQSWGFGTSVATDGQRILVGSQAGGDDVYCLRARRIRLG